MPELEDPIIAAVLVAAVVVASIIFVTAIRRSSRKRFEKLVPAFELGTTRPAGLFGTSIEGLHQGFTCRYTIETPSQHSPGGATLRVSSNNPISWSASIEDFGSRLMARFGILKDIEIGDDEMDARLRFSSDDEMALIGLFGQQRTRDALQRLSTGDSFNSIVVRTGRVDVKWAPRNPQLDEEPEAVRARMNAVIELLSTCGSSPMLGL
jgi:hypothetical protein